MLYAARHHDALALLDPFVTVAKFHAKSSRNHQKEFVLGIVVMPYEFAAKFHQLHMLAVQFRDDLWLPVIAELG